MRSTFHGLETSKRALLTTMVAMQTVGHNIANVSTEGYSRQRVNLTETRPIEAPGFQRSAQPGMIGTGVEYKKHHAGFATAIWTCNTGGRTP